MAKKKVEEKESKKYYFSKNHRDWDNLYVTWQAYELSHKQVREISRVQTLLDSSSVKEEVPCKNCP